jgi:hypothetical protein
MLLVDVLTDYTVFCTSAGLLGESHHTGLDRLSEMLQISTEGDFERNNYQITPH